MWKSILEYKKNFLFAIIANIIRVLILLSFILIFSNTFSAIINWNQIDYILYGILVSLTFDICGVFIWKPGLMKFIVAGKLNQYLVRPIHPFYGFNFSGLSATAICMLIFDIALFISVIVYFKVEVFNTFLFILFFVIIVLLFLLQDWFIRSINFWNHGLPAILWEIKESGQEFMRTYPSNFLQSNRFASFFMLVPYFFVGSLLIPLLRNYTFWEMKLQLIIVLFLIFFYSTGIWFNWSYGLKRYEAFG